MCTPSRQCAVLQRLQRDRVVEIAGVGRIDRDDRQARQVQPLRRDRFVELLRLLPGLFQGVRGEGVGQVELAEDRQRVHPRLAPRPEHLDDHPFAVVDGRREADHLEDHLVVRPGALRAGIAHGDRLREERAVDRDVGGPGRLEIGARRTAGSGVGAPRRFRRAGPRRRAAHDAIAPAPRRRWRRRRSTSAGCRCPRRGRLARRAVRRGRASVDFRPDEAETLLRALEDADDLVLFPAGLDFRTGRVDLRAGIAGRVHQVVGPIGELSAADQSLDGGFQFIDLALGQAQALGDRPRLQRPIVRAGRRIGGSPVQGLHVPRILSIFLLSLNSFQSRLGWKAVQVVSTLGVIAQWPATQNLVHVL